MTPEDIIKQAHAEIEAERHRLLVDEMKARLRNRKPLWKRLLKLRIRIQLVY